ncbi:hypothetical protein COL23_13530 [Priestia aryabhattai]|uniref:DUF6895 family protein n=1 Tax=Priestia aryabhattai TaxID=412384 RepID=UPI000BF9A72B|nr:hypothetical protein [Priestia aryabhattai]PFW75847.1 hypothetical protein COL23_13530 [Priestia aryabhattai]
MKEYTKIKLIQLSLDWIIDNLDMFCPVQENKVNQFNLKAFAELSMAYAYLSECGIPQLNKQVDILSNFMLKNLNNRNFAQMPRRIPTDAYNYLFPYFMLRTTDCQLPYYEETLQKLGKWMNPLMSEIIPYRKLEQEFMLWKAKYYHDEPDWELLSKKTLLGYMPCPLYLEEDRTYAITHALFYLTDLGKKPLGLQYIDEKELTTLLEYLLVHYLRIGNWDIVGELLINLNSLNQFDSYIYKEAAKVFESNWLDNGSIPPKRIINKEPIQESREEKFKERYHTTLVGILYCFTYLNNKSGGDINAIVV